MYPLYELSQVQYHNCFAMFQSPGVFVFNQWFPNTNILYFMQLLYKINVIRFEHQKYSQRNTKAFSGQLRNINSPVCLRSPPSVTYQKHFLERHPDQMPKPPQLAPFRTVEQQLFSKSLIDDQDSHPIPKGELRHPLEKAPFGRLGLQSHSTTTQCHMQT